MPRRKNYRKRKAMAKLNQPKPEASGELEEHNAAERAVSSGRGENPDTAKTSKNTDKKGGGDGKPENTEVSEERRITRELQKVWISPDDVSPEYPDLLENFGKCTSDVKRFQVADKWCRARDDVPRVPRIVGSEKSLDKAESFLRLGLKCAEGGKRFQALEFLNEATILAPWITRETPAAQLPYCYGDIVMNRAKLLFEMKRYAECLDDLDVVLLRGSSMLDKEVIILQAKVELILNRPANAIFALTEIAKSLRLSQLDATKRNVLEKEKAATERLLSVKGIAAREKHRLEEVIRKNAEEMAKMEADDKKFQVLLARAQKEDRRLQRRKQTPGDPPKRLWPNTSDMQVELKKLKLKNGSHPVFKSASAACVVQEDESKDKYFVAKRDLRVGDVLLIEPVFVGFQFRNGSHTGCHSCLLHTDVHQPCKGCSDVSPDILLRFAVEVTSVVRFFSDVWFFCLVFPLEILEVVFCSQFCASGLEAERHYRECRFWLSFDFFPRAEGCKSVLERSRRFQLIAASRIVLSKTAAEWETFFESVDGFEQGECDVPPPVKKYLSDDYWNVFWLPKKINRYSNKDLCRAGIAAVGCLNLLEHVHFRRDADFSESLRVKLGGLIMRHMVNLSTNFRDISHVDAKGSKILQIGVVLAPTSHLFRVACNPNLVSVPYVDHLVFRANRPIRKGEILTTAIRSPSLDGGFSNRQRYYMDTVGYICQCEACVGRWPSFVDLGNEVNLDLFKFRCAGCGTVVDRKLVECSKCRTTVRSSYRLLQCALRDVWAFSERSVSGRKPPGDLSLLLPNLEVIWQLAVEPSFHAVVARSVVTSWAHSRGNRYP